MRIEEITGVILAGGLGRRMGGVDKGLQMLGDKMLVEHVAARLAPQVGHLLINANRSQEAYARLGYPLLADAIPGFAGPLAGLHAALKASHTPFVACAPCDSPFLPEQLVERLGAVLESHAAPMAVARCGDRLHPVFCLCRCELLAPLESYLLGGGRRVAQWASDVGAVEVAFDDQVEAFRNFNSLEALHDA